MTIIADPLKPFRRPTPGYAPYVTKANVFVIGLDEGNLETMSSLPHLSEYRFQPLMSIEELQVGDIRIAELLQMAEHKLEQFDGSIDAIVGYWDFPVSSMVPILCQRFGLRGPSLESVVKCEHKYWSRLEQQKVTDAHPHFGLVDLEGDAKPPEGVRFPFWMKPVKSFSSQLAFKVKDEQEFEDAVTETREGIDRLGEPFQFVLDQLDLPPEIAEVGGTACLAEEALSGERAATEGYVYDGKAHVYGVLDSISYPEHSSFLRHQYPSQLPQHVQDRLAVVSEQVVEQIGMNWATFSVEFFCNAETGDVWILEINPRHSQTHAELFELVDGVPNHHCILRLALGRDPELPYRKGDYPIAAYFYYRHFGDGVLRQAPNRERIVRVEQEIPGVSVHPVRGAGERLSDAQLGADSYSFELADIVVGAEDEADLENKYQRCVRALGYDVDADEEPG